MHHRDGVIARARGGGGEMLGIGGADGHADGAGVFAAIRKSAGVTGEADEDLPALAAQIVDLDGDDVIRRRTIAVRRVDSGGYG